MTPAKPLPLETPVTSTMSPASNRSPIEKTWPTVTSSTLSTRNSRIVATLGRSLSWPVSGLFSFLETSVPIWTAV